MIEIETYKFILLIIILSITGTLTLILIIGTLGIIEERHKEKQKIFEAIKYKKQFNNAIGIPTKLIYKYLTSKEKEELLNFYERNLKNEKNNRL